MAKVHAVDCQGPRPDAGPTVLQRRQPFKPGAHAVHERQHGLIWGFFVLDERSTGRFDEVFAVVEVLADLVVGNRDRRSPLHPSTELGAFGFHECGELLFAQALNRRNVEPQERATEIVAEDKGHVLQPRHGRHRREKFVEDTSRLDLVVGWSRRQKDHSPIG